MIVDSTHRVGSSAHGSDTTREVGAPDHEHLLAARRLVGARDPGGVPRSTRPAYTTIQTTVYRLESKGALRIVKRISNANIFEAALSRQDAQGRVVDDLLAMLDGEIQSVMAHLVQQRQAQALRYSGSGARAAASSTGAAEIMTRALLPLVNHLWQSTLVVLIAWLVSAAVLRKAPARVRFAVELAASLKFLIPLSLFVAAGQQLTRGALLTPSQSQRVFDLVSGGVTTVLSPAQAGRAAPPQAISHSQEIVAAIVILLWAVGAGLVTWRWLVQWRQIRSLSRGAPVAGAFRGVPLLASETMRDRGIEPGVVGLWRHAIVLPAGLDSQLTPAQLAPSSSTSGSTRGGATTSSRCSTPSCSSSSGSIPWCGSWDDGSRRNASVRATRRCSSRRGEDYAEAILAVCKFYWNPIRGHASGITSANLRARIEVILKNHPPPPLGFVSRAMLASTLGSRRRRANARRMADGSGRFSTGKQLPRARDVCRQAVRGGVDQAE